MQNTRKISLAAVTLTAAMALAGCQSGEDRAEGHFQSALELMEAGDFDRARVEFLNVFQNNGLHREARSEFAAMQRARGELQESYSQYLRLVEQYPDDLEGRLALAEMALQFGNWEEAERHGSRVIEAAPDDPRIAVIETYLTYLDAVEAEDDLARGAAYAQAQELFEEDPSRFLLQRLAVDHLLRERDLEGALAAVDGSLEVEPDNRLLNDVRLSVLVELDQGEAIEGHLLTMLDRFPEDEELPATLLRYYLAIGDTDEALTFLRNQAAEATEEDVREDALVVLVRLLLETEGPDAALAELDRILAEGQASTSIFGALRASVLFDQGETETAMAELEALLEGELPVQETSRIRIALAQMLMATNNVVGARAQVEQVLEVDASQADALKMLAGWLIEEDQADRAISSLRIALDENPDDAQALTLMAQAHDRNGDDNLAREFYSLAVEASDSAPAETLRYVQILMEDSRSFFTAEELLISALRLEPGQPDVMRTLGMLYLRMQDWARAEQVETTLRDAGDEISLRVATQLEVDRLAAQGRTEEAVTFLEELAGSSGIEDVGAQIAVVRARLMNGETDEALSAIEQLVAEAPEELAYRFTLAATQSATGDLEAAEATFRALTEEAPEVEQAWVGLIRILNAQGRSEEAQAVMNDALAVLPNALDLLWAQASFLERDGDIDGAIEVYELMYERVPSSEVVANNLASLLLTYRDDQESLDRAFAVARRLRNAEIPHFQDTYGWLSYRLGDYDEALAHLEPAAQGLSEDPLVRFHLAMTYAALERYEDAVRTFGEALELAGPEDTRPQFETAQSEIERIEGVLAAQAEAETE